MKDRLRSGVRTAFVTLLVSSAAMLFTAVAARAQSVQITAASSGDRKVQIDWSAAPGDTLTPVQRQEIPTLQLSVPNSLGFPSSSALLGGLLGGAGAGGQRSGNFEILVGAPRDIFVPGARPEIQYPTALVVVGAFQYGRDYVAVTFSRPVNAGQAVLAQNYVFTPSLSVQSVRLQANGRTVILRTSAALPSATGYSVAVSGVTGADGAPLTGGSPAAFQTVAGSVVNIDQIQANPASFAGAPVTVIGQVFVPVSARTDVPNGFIQDGSGRGINIYGLTQTPVNAIGRVAAVTGNVALTGTAVRITNYQSVLLANDQPPLAPLRMPVRQARSSRWEGTYVETQARVSRADADGAAGVVRYTLTQSDTTFTGYQVWRGSSSDPSSAQLLRTYSLLDTTWTFSVGGPRRFVDPDSIITRGTGRDPLHPEEPAGALEPLDGPFNGFAYWYAVTWFAAHLDPVANPPRAEVFERQTVEQGMYENNPLYPGKVARVETPLLGEVRVVPNPYNPNAAFDKQAFPGEPRVQFINLPSRAKVDVYTVSGDLVRSLNHEEGDDSLDWDLKNNDGENVAPGIYLYHVEASGETATGRFVVVR
jgi:hypothetical protein